MLSQQLLLGVAEQLKVPLLQIARQAELARLTGADTLGVIEATADGALKLVDAYTLGVRLSLVEHAELQAEPVSISSVLYDAESQLHALAHYYGVELELNVAGRFGPVMAHRAGLQAALVSLGAALIEALPSLETPQLKLQLATHRCRYGIVAGLYADTPQLSELALREGRRLQAASRQPLVNAMHGSGTGVFLADAILRAMHLRLNVSRHHRLFGLGAVLQPNNQLQLV